MDVLPSIPVLLASCAVVFVAELVYVLFGFGAGMIAVGGLALFLPNIQDAVVLVLLINLLPEMAVVYKDRRHIRFQGVLSMTVAIGLGIPIGTWLLKSQAPYALLTGLGVVMLLVGPWLALNARRKSIFMPNGTAPVAGLASGLLSGMFGTGGPPLILYFQLKGIPKTVFRGSLMAIFLFISAIRLPVYLVGGLITADRLEASLLVLPAVLAGAWLGNRIHLQLSEAVFRRLVGVSLVVIGGLLVVRGITR